ncbi:MAG: lipase [Acidimicrobiales bacterium]|nr:lipase [Acidimicrobiales bacterium]
MDSRFEELLATLRGVQELARTETGVALRRLPSWTAAQAADPALEVMAGMPAGIRFELATDATTLELDVLATFLEVDGSPVGPTSAAFDLVVDGEEVDTQVVVDGTRVVVELGAGVFDVVEGATATVRFDGLPGDPAARVEVWLPHATTLELRDGRLTSGATLAPASGHRRRWVHHGSSISHCMEVHRPTRTWPALVARGAGVDLADLAFAGQCLLDPCVARTIRDLPADLISLKLGINVVNGDTMRERAFVPALHGFLDTIREGHPATPLIVATPIHCPMAETRPGPHVEGADGVFRPVPRPPELADGALHLVRVRELMAAAVAARRDAGDEHLHLLDGPALFGPADAGDLPDGLHPNEAGYARMADRFLELAFGAGRPFAE